MQGKNIEVHFENVLRVAGVLKEIHRETLKDFVNTSSILPLTVSLYFSASSSFANLSSFTFFGVPCIVISSSFFASVRGLRRVCLCRRDSTDCRLFLYSIERRRNAEDLRRVVLEGILFDCSSFCIFEGSQRWVILINCFAACTRRLRVTWLDLAQ